MNHPPFVEYFNQLTSKQKDEQLYLMEKEHEYFIWNQFFNRKRFVNSIALNSSYKFSSESWIDFIFRIKRNDSIK